jgi:hypothetical protein
VGEKLDFLKSAGHPPPGNVVRFAQGNVLPVEDDASRLGLVVPVDTVEKAGLSRPIRPDDGTKDPSGDVKRDPPEDRHTSKGKGQPFDLQKGPVYSHLFLLL